MTEKGYSSKAKKNGLSKIKINRVQHTEMSMGQSIVGCCFFCVGSVIIECCDNRFGDVTSGYYIFVKEKRHD